MRSGPHGMSYLTHDDKQRVTARFSTGLTRSMWTRVPNRSFAWMFQYVMGVTLHTEYGFSMSSETAERGIRSMATRIGRIEILHREIVETDDGTRDAHDNRCRYLEVQTPAVSVNGSVLCPKWSEAVAKGKRFLIVGETDKAYFIVILNREYKVLKSGPQRLTISGREHIGARPWKGSPEFRHYGQHSDRAIAAAKRAAEHEAKLFAMVGVDDAAKEAHNHPIETETKWSN